MRSLRSAMALAVMSLSGAAIIDELHSLRAIYRPRSPKKQNKVSQVKRRKYKRQGRK